MFVRVKERSNGRQAVQIVEARREGACIRQRVVKYVGTAKSDDELSAYRVLAGQLIEKFDLQLRFPLPAAAEPHPAPRPVCDDRVRVKHLRESHRVIEGVTEVFGHVYDELGLGAALSGSGHRKNDARWNDTLRACVLARLAEPASKRASVEALKRDHGVELKLERVYRMMNHVAKSVERIKDLVCARTLSLFRERVDVLFFDVTTLYFESADRDEGSDVVRGFGFSKDCKFNQTQVVLALVATTGGMPITYELFPGNTSEGTTLVAMVADLRRRFDVRDVLLVADRAMFSEQNLSLMEKEGIGYIVAAKLKAMPTRVKSEILGGQFFRPMVVQNELHWVREMALAVASTSGSETKARRLIVGYSSRRARKDAADRQKLLDRMAKKMNARSELPVSKLVGNRGDRKYLAIEKTRATLDPSKIAADAQWDGLHGVITNVQRLTAEAALSRYRELWQIEAAFRLNKHELAMRPIYHWTPKRIRAHIAICYLAYAVAKHALKRVEPSLPGLSFERLREELVRVEASILRDVSTQKHYRLPSCLTPEQRTIYRALGLRRVEATQLIPKPNL